jgi:uncharacterized protein YbjQ (UPF0145 family)
VGLKKIKKPNGEVYYIDERGRRVFSTSLDNLNEAKTRDIADEDLRKKVILTTETSPVDVAINERIDVISAEYIFPMNSFEEFFDSDDKDMNREIKFAQNVLRNAKENALRELRIEALNLNADAVIGVNLSYTEFYNKRKSMVLLMATGTAVKLKL